MSSSWPKSWAALGDGFGGLGAQVAGAVEAEELAGGITGLDDAVGKESEGTCRAQEEAVLFVRDAEINAQRKSRGDGRFRLHR